MRISPGIVLADFADSILIEPWARLFLNHVKCTVMGNRQPLPIGHHDMSNDYIQRPVCDRLTTDRITARP
jgi:hypothetical protein